MIKKFKNFINNTSINKDFQAVDEYLRLNISFDILDWVDEKSVGITNYHIDIFQNEVLAGQMIASKYDRAVITNISQSLMDWQELLFRELFNGHNFAPKVRKMLGLDKLTAKDFLLLRRIEILPKFRGMQIGENVFELIDKSIGKFCVTALDAFPLQLEGDQENLNIFGEEWAKQMNLDDFVQDEQQAFKKLIKYYKDCGFQEVTDCDVHLMIRKKKAYQSKSAIVKFIKSK